MTSFINDSVIASYEKEQSFSHVDDLSRTEPEYENRVYLDRYTSQHTSEHN